MLYYFHSIKDRKCFQGQPCSVMDVTAMSFLCEAAQQQALVVQQLHEEVRRRRLKGAWEQLLHLIAESHQIIATIKTEEGL